MRFTSRHGPAAPSLASFPFRPELAQTGFSTTHHFQTSTLLHHVPERNLTFTSPYTQLKTQSLLCGQSVVQSDALYMPPACPAARPLRKPAALPPPHNKMQTTPVSTILCYAVVLRRATTNDVRRPGQARAVLPPILPARLRARLRALFPPGRTARARLVRSDRLAARGSRNGGRRGRPARLPREPYVFPPCRSPRAHPSHGLLLAKFLDVLHDAIRSALRDGIDEEQKNAAIQTQQGWMHIHGIRSSSRLRASPLARAR